MTTGAKSTMAMGEDAAARDTRDGDLAGMGRKELAAEVRRLRDGIRAHRDSTGHDLCWHHPQLWGLLPEPVPAHLSVPAWPQFLRGCVKYRQSLDEQLPNAPRTTAEYDDSGW